MSNKQARSNLDSPIPNNYDFQMYLLQEMKLISLKF